MKLPKDTTLLTRERLYSVNMSPIDIMVYDVESIIAEAFYEGKRVILINPSSLRGYVEGEGLEKKIESVINAMGYTVSTEGVMLWVGL